MRAILGLAFASLFQAQQTAATVDYTRDVAPIFRKNCYACHGPALQTSGFRLDDPATALKGGYGGPSIIPGQSGQSKLIQRVEGAKGVPAMPPAGPRLTKQEIDILRSWIDNGAKYAEAAPATPAKPAALPAANLHWAFRPIARPAPPPVRQPNWVRNPIDAFILARLEKQSIQPSPEAPRRTLLRRLSFDLTGLPPTIEEMESFLADTSPGAYEKQVDRLLASPHFGEKWARSWLDQARYADSDGYEKDWFRPWAWRWRNWVIDAFNRDLPFDRFTIEQIAGDLLPHRTLEQHIATGFHRNTLTNREGGVDSVQFEFENAVDRASTVGAVWLGLSVGCAQCHDHKYDPITQKDFYSFFAYFDNVEELDIDAPLDGELGPWLRTRDEYRARRAQLLHEYNVPELQSAWEKDILYTISHPGERTDWDLAWDCVLKLTEGGDGGKIVQIPPAQRTPREQDILTDHFVGNAHFAYGSKRWKEMKLDELEKKLKALKQEYPQLTQAQVIVQNPKPKRSFLRVRGDYKSPGIEVHPSTPAALPLPTSGSRLDLARWLTSNENPLTARVAVNRIWQEIFGAGLVKTPDDFGARSEPPSHPELLDWLASTFRDNGWSRKQLIRLIVTSAAYRQSSNARPGLKDIDPANTLLARQSRLRLPAELIRDSALAAAGLLTPTIGGPSIRPPIPAGVMELSYASRYSGYGWKESEGPNRYRRGLYIQFLRTTPYPQLINFDAPKAVVASCRRDRSNTPLQALNLLNDPVFVEAAQAFAYRILTSPQPDFPSRLNWAFQTALSRSPTAAETVRLEQYLNEHVTLLAPATPHPELAAWTGLASVILNLDEFITRE